MRKNRVLNEKLYKQISSLKQTRGRIDTFLYSFLANCGYSTSLYFHVMDTCDREELKMVALSQHIVSLMSSCETLFRDVFVYITSIDSDFVSNIISTYKLTLNNNVGDDLTIIDVLPEYFNFQDFNDLEKAFKPLVNNSFSEELGVFEIPFFYSESKEIKKFSLDKYFNNWKSDFNDFIIERHNITHDANYRTTIDYRLIERYQNICLYFPQIFCIWISSKYNSYHLALNLPDGKVIPYIMSLKDLISEWEEVNE